MRYLQTRIISLSSLLLLSGCGDFNMSRVNSNEEKACLNVVRKYESSFVIPPGMRDKYLHRALTFANTYSLNGAVSFAPGVVESKNPKEGYWYYITAPDSLLTIHCGYAVRSDTSIAIAKDNEHFASYYIQTNNTIACPQLIRK